MKKQSDIRYIKENKLLYIALFICFTVFFLAVYVLIASFNGLIEKHDQRLSGEICNLVSEKMNNSISSSTEAVERIASVLSTQNFDNPEDIYNILKKEEKYESMGFIDENLNIYGTDYEKEEFEKWSLVQSATLADPVSMSVPYRSTTSGQPVITMFAKTKYGKNKKGWLFATSRFKDLQDVATTSVFLNDIDIWIMDAESANMIRCNSNEQNVDGSWSNCFLIMQTLDSENKEHYYQWFQKMQKGSKDLGMNYILDGVYYSQYASQISSMPGWYVVVRIPSSVLSDTMSSFRNYVLNFIVVLLVVVLFLIFVMYRVSKRENEMLEELSIRDPLTGLFNRRAFDVLTKKWLDSKKNAALIFLDLDYFKQINDNLGHDAGDMLLSGFADILTTIFGEKGLAFRVGGDEFVVIVESDSVEEITEKMRQTQQEVASISLPNFKEHGVEGKVKVSFSAGLAMYPENASNLSNLKKCADTALYDVKERGRNGFCWYSNL